MLLDCQSTTDLGECEAIRGMFKLFAVVTIKSNRSDRNNEKQMLLAGGKKGCRDLMLEVVSSPKEQMFTFDLQQQFTGPEGACWY